MDEADVADSGLRDAVAATTARFSAALAAGDAATAVTAYTEDARLLPPYASPMFGRAEIEAFWRAGIQAGITLVVLETHEVRREGEVAYEIGRYRLQLSLPEGEGVLEEGSYLLVHERQSDGSWLRRAETLHPDASSLPAPLPRSCNVPAQASSQDNRKGPPS